MFISSSTEESEITTTTTTTLHLPEIFSIIKLSEHGSLIDDSSSRSESQCRSIEKHTTITSTQFSTATTARRHTQQNTRSRAGQTATHRYVCMELAISTISVKTLEYSSLEKYYLNSHNKILQYSNDSLW